MIRDRFCWTFGLVGLSAAACLGLPAMAEGEKRGPLPEAEDNPVGFPGVAAAKEAVLSKEGVEVRTIRDWTVVSDESTYTIWSFAPESYPAYPAVVKRQVISKPYGSDIQMNVLCEDDKDVCDDLVCTFADMNGLPQEGC